MHGQRAAMDKKELEKEAETIDAACTKTGTIRRELATCLGGRKGCR